MERYAPKYMELASRDIVTRAIISEIEAGRGCGELADHVLLDISHLEPAFIAEHLPSTQSIAQQFGGVDVTKDSIPVYPTAHYTMGGIPATRECRVISEDGIVEGLYAIGEAACNSVHGANRLGCNSLLDLVVFGKHAGEQAAAAVGHAKLTEKDTEGSTLERAISHFDATRHASGEHTPRAIRDEMSRIMQDTAGIIRTGNHMQRGLEALQHSAAHFHSMLGLTDHNLIWNNELVAAIETENLLMQGIATLASANYRTESRGAHYRSDFPHRDDDHWLAHTVVNVNHDGKAACDLRAVRLEPDAEEVETIAPEARVY